jgi:hypothetical protein
MVGLTHATNFPDLHHQKKKKKKKKTLIASHKHFVNLSTANGGSVLE